MNLRWLTRAALLAAAACATAGCVSLVDQITRPERDDSLSMPGQRQFERRLGVTQSHVRTPQGVDIAWYLVPAADRGMRYAFHRNETEVGFKTNFKRIDDEIEPLPARGTVVYLHGWNLDSGSMLPWALALSGHGYRGIAIDLRNHGDSGQAAVGYGPREATDVVAVLDQLQRRGDLKPPVYLFGVSYGAAVALFAEPALRGHIAGIVAMEPFANAAGAVHDLFDHLRSRRVHGLRNRLFRTWLRHRYREADIDIAIVQAGQRLRLDLGSIDVADTLSRTQTCTLLLHGAKDRIIPKDSVQSLAGASHKAEYLELPEENHLTLPLRIDWVGSPIADWLQAQANSSADRCTTLLLPPDPADAGKPKVVR